jgi:hypothetical protein
MAEMMNKCIEDPNPDNPVYRVVTSNIMKDVSTDMDVGEYLVGRLDRLESLVLEQSRSRRGIKGYSYSNERALRFHIDFKDSYFSNRDFQKEIILKLSGIGAIVSRDIVGGLNVSVSPINISEFDKIASKYVREISVSPMS